MKIAWQHRSSIWIGCLLTLVLILTHHVFFYFGHYGIDDMWYAKLAAGWLHGEGKIISADHYAYRWTIIAWTALSYAWWGINDWASGFFPMLHVLAGIFLLTQMARSKSQLALAAIILFITEQWTLYYSDKLMPDTYLTFYVLMGWFGVWKARESTSWKRWILLAAVSWFLGFLTKGTILLTYTAILPLLIVGLRRKRERIKWIYWILASGILYLFYFGWMAVLDSPWSRFDAIAANSYFNECSYDQLPAIHVLRRVGYELWEVFLKTGLVAMLWMSLVRWLINRSFDFWDWVLIFSLLAANFMSISASDYVPLCPEFRHYLFLVPLAAWSAARTLLILSNSPNRGYWLVPIGLLFFAWLAYYLHYASWLYTFLPLGIVSLLSMIIPKWGRIWFFLFLLNTLWVPYRVFRYAGTTKYFHQRNVFNEVVLPEMNKDPQIILLSNHVQLNYAEYDTKFNKHWQSRFYRYQDSIPGDFEGDVLVYINGWTRYQSEMPHEKLPLLIKQYYDNQLSIDQLSNLYHYEEITILKLPLTSEVRGLLSEL